MYNCKRWNGLDLDTELYEFRWDGLLRTRRAIMTTRSDGNLEKHYKERFKPYYLCSSSFYLSDPKHSCYSSWPSEIEMRKADVGGRWQVIRKCAQWAQHLRASQPYSLTIPMHQALPIPFVTCRKLHVYLSQRQVHSGASTPGRPSDTAVQTRHVSPRAKPQLGI